MNTNAISEPPPTSYSSLWKKVPRYLGYLAPNLVLALSVPLIITILVPLGGGLLVLWVGFPLLFVALMMARGFGAFELSRLRAAGMPPIPQPQWPSATSGSLWQRFKAVALGADYWRYALFSFLFMMIAPLSWGVMLVWITLPLALPSYLLNLLIGNSYDNYHLGNLIYLLLSPPAAAGFPLSAGMLNVLIDLAIGIIGLATMPWVMHAMVWMHQGLAQKFLARSTVARLSQQVQDLSSSRAAATSAEGRALKRLERDIHDGPQQQLLRLQLDLEAAERRMKDDPIAAAQLVSEARLRSHETLSELRQLSRGIAPPLLQDRGLAAAVEGLAERNTIPTTVTIQLDPQLPIPEAIQQNAYFVVSELYANATKHSRASQIRTMIGVTDPSQGDPRYLCLQVSDNGVGGANWTADGGLAGLHERLHGLGGTMDVTSPGGGPTIINAYLPL